MSNIPEDILKQASGAVGNAFGSVARSFETIDPSQFGDLSFSNASVVGTLVGRDSKLAPRAPHERGGIQI